MPALAEKTVDRASKLAPDVAEGPASVDLEAPTEDEDLMGNAASVDAMMEAEPDEPGDDGGGILAAMMASEEEEAGPEEPGDVDPLAGMDLPTVGEGNLQGTDEDDAVILDCHGVEVTAGVRVLYEGALWTVTTALVEDFDDDEWAVELVGESDGEATLDESSLFAVVTEEASAESSGPAVVIPEGVVGGVVSGSGGGGGGSQGFADSIASRGSAHAIKVRTHTDDVYKERGIADAETHRWQDHVKRSVIPKKARAKLWSDAKEEFDGLDGAEVTKQAPKYRKMMVRAVERLDDYALQVDTARALTEAHLENDYRRFMAADADGNTEDADMYRDAMATLKEYKDKLADSGPMVHGMADTTHERSQEVVRWSDEVALMEKSPAAARMRGEDVTARAEQYRDWVDRAFHDRVEGKNVANDAHGITRAIRDDAIYGKRSKSFLKRKAKRGKKDVQGVGTSAMGKAAKAPYYAMSMLTGGMVGVEERAVHGGASTKRAVDFNTWKTNFEKVRLECALIEEDALYGSHTGLYTSLKMLADFGLPTLQGVLKALSVWGVLLAAVSLGSSLGLSAIAGTSLLVVTALKAALELVLALWSAKKVEDYTDRDARKKRHAKAERWKHGKAFAADTASVAAAGMLSTKASGKTMSPDKAVTERFEDLKNTDDRSQGAVSTAKGRKAIGLPKEKRVGMDGIGHTTGETPKAHGGVRKGVHVGTAAGIDRTARMMETGGRDAEREREHRIAPMVGHGLMKGMRSDDRFFSHESLAGPAPTSKAPAPPSAAGPAPDHPAPAPPSEASVDEDVAVDASEADSEKAATAGSKVTRMASKMAAGMAKVSEKVDEIAPKAEDEEAADKAAAIAQISEDAAVVAEALP